MSGRFLKIGGVVAAGGAAYYLYNAGMSGGYELSLNTCDFVARHQLTFSLPTPGGDPKAAEKRFEADATKLSNQVQNNLPGKADEAKKDAQVAQADISSKANELAKDARSQIDKADKNFEKYKADAEKRIEQGGKEAADKANSAIDKFDKSVTEVSSIPQN